MRDQAGRFVKGHVNIGHHVPPKPMLLEDRFVATVFEHWKRSRNKALNKLLELDPRSYIELLGILARYDEQMKK